MSIVVKRHLPMLFSTVLAAGAALAQPSATHAAFGPGEQSTYSVEYLGVTAGSAQITVGAPSRQWGHEVLPIVTLARSQSVVDLYPIRDRFVTYYSPLHDRSIGSDFFADENRVKRRERVKLDHDTGRATVVKQKQGADERLGTHDIEAGASDIAAVTFALRNRPLQVGRTFEFPVFTGSRSFTLRATVEQTQMLQTVLGTREVYKIRVETAFSGKLQSKRDLFAYLTTDEAHIPVRIEAEFVLGTIRAHLKEYKSGQRYAKATTAALEGSGGM
jgi:hypothetical protein